MRCNVQNLRNLRDARSWTLDDLAQKSGLEVDVVTRAEKSGQLDSESAEKIANALLVEKSSFMIPKPFGNQLLQDLKVGLSSSINKERRDFTLSSVRALGSLFIPRSISDAFAEASFGLIAYEKIESIHKNNAEYRELGFNVLFGEANNQFFKTSVNNPYSLVTGTTPPTRDALNSILANFSDHATKFSELTEETCFSNVDGTIILLGGPVANLHSRQIMGIGDGSPLFGFTENRRINLPIFFKNVSSALIGPSNKPRYEIIVNGHPIPQIDTDSQNYFVLTSIPNVFSSFYGVFDHRIVIISGLNGVGTRAIQNVLQDPRLLADLLKTSSGSKESSNKHSAWQAIFHITEYEKETQLPTKLGEHKIIPIEGIDFDNVRKKVEGGCFWIDEKEYLTKA